MPNDKFTNEVLKLRKNDILNQIKSVTEYTSKTELAVDEISIIREEVKTLKAEIRALKLEIFKYNAATKEQENKISLEEFGELDSELREVLRKCNVVDPEIKNNVINSIEKSNAVLPLEKFSLFTWSGDIAKWNSWFSLFQSTIDKNPHLTSSQKFLYLKKYLSGEPLAICDQLDITDYNYNEALSLLKTRYQNERRLGSYYLSQLIHFSRKYHSSDLAKFLTIHRSSVAALKNMNDITDLADFIFFHLAYNNLDNKMQKDFDMSRLQESTIPKLEELLQFVQFAATNEELKFDFKFEKKREEYNPKVKFQKYQTKQSFVGVTQSKINTSKFVLEKACPCCSQSHKLYLCEKFKSLSADRRAELVKQWRRCQNCLGVFHEPCPSSLSCFVCKRMHHTLLHQDAQSKASGLVSCAISQNKTILLGTIECEIKDNFNTFIPLRILVDSGAQTSVVTQDLMKKLGLPIQYSSKSVKGLAENEIQTVGQIDVEIKPRKLKNSPVLSVSAVVLKQKRLCGNLPAKDVPQHLKTNFMHLELADPNFTKSSEINMILGADVIPKILESGNQNLYKDGTGLIAQKTIFGYVISGAVPEDNRKSIEVLISTQKSEISSLEENMEKFWRSEEVVAHTLTDPDDLYCENLFTSTTRRLSDGRFSVKLPFKPGAHPENLKNRSCAINSYKNLEKRLLKDETLLEEYKKQILSYLNLDQIVARPFGTSSYILTQVVVCRASATTTQMRICFNASTMAFEGPGRRSSLNDLLLPGPKLQTDLNFILTRFRLNKVGLIADVEMMFRRIEVDPEDRKFLHIFYRDSPDADLEELELKVLPFGLRCSPYLAQRAVHELLNSDGHYFPQASAALKKSLYVDDFVGSFSSVEEATLMKTHLTQLMKRGGFVLRKWASSHAEVLKDTPLDNKGKICFDDENRTVKVLGLQWDAIDDSFTYKILEFASPVTKRSCLSYIARTFDSLGLVCPAVFWMKLFLQKLWTIKVDWDDPLPDDLVKKWEKFTQEITLLEQLRIPRCILQNDADVLLACFSDGSQVGYAACIYLVARYPDRQFSSALLTAKSKLAPLSTISIPRLELNGALLMSQLCHNILQALDEVQIKDIYLFTDSQIVLTWIRTPAFRLKTYVANRVSKIQQLTEGMHWSYVSTKENPSDYATRGLFPSQLLNNSLWWAGPDFLKENPEKWSTSLDLSTTELNPQEIPELKATTILMLNKVHDENNFFSEILSKCSTFGKLQRVMAYILRFISNTRKTKAERQTGSLLVSELEDSITKCVLLAQHQDFAEEIKSLQGNKSPSRRLIKLTPYLDPKGVMRVGGRLGNALLSENEKHPIILSKISPLSKLICEHYHQILLHTGPRTTRAIIQRRFWITSLHSLVRKIIHRCPRCIRWQCKPKPPEMGSLPSSRVRPSRCFASTTMDMAGPFIVTETRRRKSPQHKIYICVFVCESTKAIHMEPVSELSTAAFLAAFQRFVSRRSLPYRLRSDNGRNFIGARRQLKECQAFLRDHNDEITSFLSSREVIWELNPAYSPHFGGLHEAAIKSAKLLFYKVVGNTILTLEEFNTLLTRIEAVLNSRPLCFLSNDPTEGVDYLSPGHFLVGGPLVTVPENPLDLQIHVRNRWEMVQQMSQTYWKRYQREYLHSLITREKWSKGTPNLSVGQLVYISGEKTSPLTWPLGKIVNIHPGADGVVRVVDIKVGDSVVRRAVHKLIVIPANNEF